MVTGTNRWRWFGAIIVGVVVIAVALVTWRRSTANGQSTAHGQSTGLPSGEYGLVGGVRPTQTIVVPVPNPIPQEKPPWESKSSDPPPAAHLIAAWRMDPPHPAPVAPAARPPAPPNPALYRPPLHNVDVNGDRPPRPAP
jgi:hypothetical protein